jgi:hypothetical protein
LFLASHADGTIVVYDKEREDGTFIPQEPVGRPPSADGTTSSYEEGVSQREWDPTDAIFVTMPPWHPVISGSGVGKTDKEKSAKNPVSHWRVSNRSVLGPYFPTTTSRFSFIRSHRFRLFARREVRRGYIRRWMFESN